MLIEFDINCIPPKHTAQGSSTILKNFKTGKFFIGKKNNSNATRAKNELIALIAPYTPEKPLEGPLRLSVIWAYPWRASEPKKNRLLGYRMCDTKPDCDNLTKQLADILTRLGFWYDDAQVAELRFTKMWREKPGIHIEISKPHDFI